MANASLSTPPRTPRTPNAEEKPLSTEFDIIATYNDLIRDDPSITPPIAAIESLINLLASSPLTTISETLALLSTHSRKLLASQRNPIPLSAGTDLFQRYLISSFQQRPSSLANSDFSTLRHHIIAQSSLFVKNAGTARSKIARHALPFIIKKDASTSTCTSTIVTFGYSRVVHAVLAHAAEHSPSQSRSFDVICVTRAASSSSSSASSLEETSLAKLASLGIPTATIPLHALPYALSSLPTPPQVLLGASAVLENGAVVSDLGSHAVGLMAQAFNVPLHVCVESYKFVRNFPLGCGPGDLTRMGVRQDVLKFSDPASDAASDVGDGDGVHERKGDDYFASEGNSASAIPEAEADGNGEGEGEGYGPHEDPMIEITPPELISALITENGIMTPHAVSEELIKLWF